MFIKLDEAAKAILCCPFCKSTLERRQSDLECRRCGSDFTQKAINTGGQSENVIDFRLNPPPYARSSTFTDWKNKQRHFENVMRERASNLELCTYLDEINSVKEIYTQEFSIQGDVLDIGGDTGKLRHFLDPGSNPLYISIDPFIGAFEHHGDNRTLLQAYPSLKEPCNFLAGRAEELPFIASAFNWVHMRSVIDHFEDPYRALKEAYRVLRPGGKLLVGISIVEKKFGYSTPLGRSPEISLIDKLKRKHQQGGIRAIGAVVSAKFKANFNITEKTKMDHHTFRFTHEEVRDLMKSTGFLIEKEHWQKPPFEYVLYLSATRQY